MNEKKSIKNSPNSEGKKVVTVTFCGGATGPTGSNFLVEIENHKFLVDCGMFQGKEISEGRNNESFLYKPSEIEVLFVTHSHLDHIGRIPKLIQEGFRGIIYSTPPTKEITELMLMDSLNVLTRQARARGEEAPYSGNDIKTIMSLWQTKKYGEVIEMKNGSSVIFRDSGHILGSAMIEIKYNDKKLLFTGDLGNTPAPLLKDTEKINDVEYIIMESVYGDRNHEDKEIRGELLKKAVLEIIRKKGTLLIPVFSIERTQEMLFEFNRMVEKGEIPMVPIFLDSPLAIKVTRVYKKYENYYNEKAKEIIRSGDDIFQFPMLRFTMEHNDSLAIDVVEEPKIIMAGSGMSNGGRILRHEKKYLSDPQNALLLVGFQAAGTLGRELQEGAKKVSIDDEDVKVKAKVSSIHGYSAHKDSDNLLDFVEEATEKDKLRKVFVVLGEPKSSLCLSQKIRDYLEVDAQVVREGSSVELSF